LGLISSSDLPWLALPFCGLAPSVIYNCMIINATVFLSDVKPPKLFEFFNDENTDGPQKKIPGALQVLLKIFDRE